MQQKCPKRISIKRAYGTQQNVADGRDFSDARILRNETSQDICIPEGAKNNFRAISLSARSPFTRVKTYIFIFLCYFVIKYDNILYLYVCDERLSQISRNNMEFH